MRFPDNPLACLPRAVRMLLLLAFLAVSAWNISALAGRDSAHEGDIAERLDRGDRIDMDMYRSLNARVAEGQDYYTAVAQEHRAFGFPTTPFFAVRTPVLAWTTALWGAQGWRIIASLLWAANVLAWWSALAGRVSRAERASAALMAALFGAIAFIPEVATSHESLAGLMLSLAIALRERTWAAALVLTGCAVALRELALPFLLLWLALAVLEKRRGEAIAVAAVVAALLLGLALHAGAVAGVRLPGDEVSPGWSGMLGPSLPLYGIHVTTLLQTLPLWVAGPLGVLPLLGWIGLGGRMGAFAAGWFAGFMLFVALFARQENFYWMALFVPAYGIGLAFVPRAVAAVFSRPMHSTATP